MRSLRVRRQFRREMSPVPCGLSASGLPLGIQLVSGMFTEPALLAAAAWSEDVLGRGAAPGL